MVSIWHWRSVWWVPLRQQRDQETPDVVELRDDGGALVFEETDAALVVGGGGVFGAGFAEELRRGWQRWCLAGARRRGGGGAA
jgi:hypothetical protein